MPGFAQYKQPANVVMKIFSNQYPRKGPRRLVEQLMADARKPPENDNKKQAMVALALARTTLLEKVADDTDRLKSINDAEVFYDQAFNHLSNEPKVDGSQPKGPEAQGLDENEQQRKVALERALQLLGDRIGAANVPATGRPAVLPNKRELETSVLLGRAASLQLELNAATKGAGFDKIEGEIDMLGDRVEELDRYVADGRKVRSDASAATGPLMRADAALFKMRKAYENRVDSSQTKLSGLYHALAAAVDAPLIIPSAIEKLSSKISVELESFDKDERKYVQAAAKAIEDDYQLLRAYDTFDDKINPKMQRLQAFAQPLGDPAYGDAVGLSSKARGRIPEILAGLGQMPKAEELINGLDEELDKRIEGLQGKVDTLQDEVRQARIALMQDTDPRSSPLKDTRDQAVFATNWKQIDAAEIGLQKMLPVGAIDSGSAVSNLKAAFRLCEQAKALVEEVRKAQNAAGSFDSGLSTLEKDIAAAKGKDAALAKYDAASIAALDKQLKKFKQAQPTMLAEAAQQTLGEIRKAFDEKKNQADAVALAVGSTDADYKSWTAWALASTKGDSGVKEGVNSLYVALKPLKAALEAKPAVKADIERTYNDAKQVFGAFKDEGEAVLGAQGAKAGLENKAAEAEKLAEELRQRLKVLRERLPVAKTEVEKAKGDPNPIKTIEDLIKQADGEIGTDAASAKKTLDRIEQRIDLVYADPAGGMARSRKELPDLLAEWRTARSSARKGLDTLFGKLDEFGQIDGESAEAVEPFKDRLSEYMVLFAGSTDPLEAPIKILADPNAPDEARRRARETAMAEVLDKLRSVQAHPLTAQLVGAPFPGVPSVPKRLIDTLDWLHYSIMTSVS